MGQLERYGLYVLVVVIFLILGVAIWGEDPQAPQVGNPANGPEPLNVASNQPAPSARLNPFIGSPVDAFVDDLLPEPAPASNPTTGDDVPFDSNLDRLPVAVDNAVIPPTPAPAPARTYVVQRGDSFAKISRKLYGNESHADEIMALNGISNPFALRAGQTLRLPEAASTPAPTPGPSSGERTYTVVAGDSPARISQKLFGHERYATEIMKLNGITDPQALRPDQVLRLPDVGGGPRASVVAVQASAGPTYTVEPGDSFARISRKLFGTESHAADIMKLNGIDDPQRLLAGSVIRVPVIAHDGE